MVVIQQSLMKLSKSGRIINKLNFFYKPLYFYAEDTLIIENERIDNIYGKYYSFAVVTIIDIVQISLFLLAALLILVPLKILK